MLRIAKRMRPLSALHTSGSSRRPFLVVLRKLKRDLFLAVRPRLCETSIGWMTALTLQDGRCRIRRLQRQLMDLVSIEVHTW